MGRYGLFLALAAALVVGAYAFWWSAGNQGSAERAYESAAPSQRIVIPEVQGAAARGRLAFNQNCAGCHGRDALGGAAGPPLIHKIYEPGHHADGAFLLAVRQGVRQHHWKFGDMPPQPQVTEAEMADIIAFVREAQRANGIE